MKPFLLTNYARFKAYDIYGNGRIAILVSLYVYILLASFNIYNLNFSINQTFFFVVPVISAIGASHTHNISSLKQRNDTFIVFLVFAACGVFGFTIVEKYNTYALLVFSFALYFAFMTVTSYPSFNQYRGLIPTIFVISFLTMLVGGAGQFYVAINRVISISIAGFIGYIALQLVPEKYYYKIWFNATYTLYKRITDQLHLVVIDNSYKIIFYGDCLLKMNHSLNYTNKSKHYEIFKECTTAFNKYNFGVALAYNNYEKYNRNGCLSNLYHLMKTLQDYFRDHKMIPDDYIKQIIKHQYTAPNSDMRNIWQTLYEITINWNTLCLTYR